MVALFSLALFSAMSAPAGGPRVVILQVGPSSHALSRDAYKALEGGLQPNAVVLPAGSGAKAMHGAHVKAEQVRRPSIAVKVAQAVGATHVLVLDAVGGKVPHLSATFIEVDNGKILLKLRKEVSGKQLSVAAAAGLSEQLKHRFGASNSPAGGSEATSARGADVTDDAAEESTDVGGVAAAPSAEQSEPTATGDPAGVSQTIEPVASFGERHRPGLLLVAGPAAIQRTATMTGTSLPTQTTLPCYCGAGHNSNPLFAALAVGAELYPLSLTSNDGLASGLGVFGDAIATRVGSYVGNELRQSNVVNASAGVAWRLVLWDAATAPDVTLKGGYEYVSFPLHGSAFPGVQYMGPYAGLRLTVPIEIPELALILAGSYTPFGPSAATALGRWQSGYGVGGEAGLRVQITNGFALSAMYRADLQTMAFTNAQVHLPTGDVVSSNIRLSDLFSQLMVTASVAF